MDLIHNDDISKKEGTRVDELSYAVEKLLPKYVVMSKYDSSFGDLFFITQICGLPVGVEWQGIWLDNNGKEFYEGHYSIVDFVDEKNNIVNIIDPDKNSLEGSKSFTFSEFSRRWWDFNKVPYVINKISISLECYNENLMFFLIPKSEEKYYENWGYWHTSIDIMKIFQKQPNDDY